MKKYVLVFLFSIISIPLFSQILFEKGYIIYSDGSKKECLIKNIDWKSSPSYIVYKDTNGEEYAQKMNDVKEFAVENGKKFTKATVQIDQSNTVTSSLSDKKEPIFQTKEVMLEVLLTGKMNLYYYEDDNIKRYFFNSENSTIEPLIYKEYYVDSQHIKANEQFKQQIFLAFREKDFSMDEISKLTYTRNSLYNIFEKFNNQFEAKNTVIKKERTANEKYNFFIKAGVQQNNLDMFLYTNQYTHLEFDSKLTQTVGLEFEYIFGFNKNKWAINFDANYYTPYKTSSKKNVNNSTKGDAEIQNFTLGLGAKHYIFLNQNSKLFIGLVYHNSFRTKKSMFNGEIDYGLSKRRISYEFEKSAELAYKFGYVFKEKYSLEFKYISKTRLFYLPDYNSSYSAYSLSFGYNFW